MAGKASAAEESKSRVLASNKGMATTLDVQSISHAFITSSLSYVNESELGLICGAIAELYTRGEIIMIPWHTTIKSWLPWLLM